MGIMEYQIELTFDISIYLNRRFSQFYDKEVAD